MRGALNGLFILLLCVGAAFALVLHKQAEKRERAAAAQRVAEAAEAPPPVAPRPPRAPATTPAPAVPVTDRTPLPAPTDPPAAAPTAAPQLAAPTRKPVHPYWYEGAGGWDAARKEQLDANAPLLVYFHTTWCGWCKKLDNDLLPSLSVDRVLRDVVKVKLNPEASAEERTLAARFGVHGYPSVFVLAGPRAMPIKLHPFAGDGSAAPAEFVLQLERAGATALP